MSILYSINLYLQSAKLHPKASLSTLHNQRSLRIERNPNRSCWKMLQAAERSSHCLQTLSLLSNVLSVDTLSSVKRKGCQWRNSQFWCSLANENEHRPRLWTLGPLATLMNLPETATWGPFCGAPAVPPLWVYFCLSLCLFVFCISFSPHLTKTVCRLPIVKVCSRFFATGEFFPATVTSYLLWGVLLAFSLTMLSTQRRLWMWFSTL